MSERFKTWGPPAALLVGALAVRLALMPGMYASDDLAYRGHAHRMLTGGFRPVDHFTGRIGFIAPLAACEAMFGVNDLAGALFPTACGLLQVFAVYWIGCTIKSREVGLAAGIVAATVPNSVFWGGLAWSDVPASAFMALSVAFWLCDKRWSAAAAGAAMGAAYLQRESSVLLAAFFVAAWMFKLAPFRRVLWAAAGSIGVLVLESLVFWTLWGDPLGRVHAITAGSYSEDVVAAYIPDLTHRLTTKIPSMMFNPLNGEFPFFGAVFLAALVGAAVMRRDPSARRLLLWWASLFLAIMFVPVYLSPYKPAVIGQPKDLEPLVPAAAVLVGLAVAGRLRRSAWAAVSLVALLGVGAAFKLKVDSSLRTAGPKEAHAVLAGRPCFTDARTAMMFRYWDGFATPERVREFREAPSGLVVYDEQWIGFLKHHYDYKPPEPGPEWEVVHEIKTPGRWSLRAALFGGEQPTAGPRTIIYRVP